MRRLAPVLALLALAPWVAECSWGGFAVTDYPLVLAFLGPLYGGAAVLIREIARRTGGGWPAIVLLAAAFGVVQAGLVDQSLFNPGFLDDTGFADLDAGTRETLVPVLGFSVQQALEYVGNHIALSVCAPIVIVESFLPPQRRTRPWLGRPGLAAVGVLYLLNSLLIFSDDGGRKGFLADPVQLSVAALTALALVGAALLPRWQRNRRPAPAADPQPEVPRTAWPVAAGSPQPAVARVPHPALVGALVLAAHLGATLPNGWLGVAARSAAMAVVVTAVVVLSRRAGWGQRHVLAAWGAGLVNAAAFAYLAPSYAPASPAEALTSDVIVSVLTLALLGGAFWRLRHEPG
ncbi:hypothetical protein [Micromonospora sp. CA-111912]|uniref:hypothetical protein n=1 Tax=Micromonospora sp. CA-111912 TaxID=3239955 RepID=UPI003D90A79A